ncbi:hypothetical protein [Trichormus variabilis]|uniref:Uncharacterized protein n=1 Tax=Trichormus variabilis SAG 1403-4b TaxID=447716 RepID=A0A3S1CSW0_ANAVA|nr:hypothetical protein [Trichormus variabilis]MBD2627503.1 hypothetical protein [Trichormus variabilis FACHB-164]RUS97729.1 hypothetical protein DSM107003_16040 [Trichormus variabilis SAG 1403-4b]
MLNQNLGDVDIPDLIALDKHGNSILVGKIRGFPFNYPHNHIGNDLWRMIENWQPSVREKVEFAMFVDLEDILIFKWNGHEFSEIINFNTNEIFNHYDSSFSNKRIFSLYLTGLTEGWIRDLAYHWKSEIPPKFKEIDEIGLLKLLEDGDTTTLSKGMLLNS